MAGRKNGTTAMIHQAAERFRALADETRLRLIYELKAGERNVSTLIEATGFRQACVSKHLGILRRAGVVVARREGVMAFYRIKDAWVFELCDLMCESVRKHHEDLHEELGIAPKKANRKGRSRS